MIAITQLIEFASNNDSEKHVARIAGFLLGFDFMNVHVTILFGDTKSKFYSFNTVSIPLLSISYGTNQKLIVLNGMHWRIFI